MSDPFVGEIRQFCGNFAPNNWAFCNGQQFPIRAYPALFSVIGNTYGGTVGSTFAVPNLVDSVPMHQGQGPGLSPRVLGQSGGENDVVLTESTLATHSHAPDATSSTGDQLQPGDCRWAQSSQRDKQFGPTPDKPMAPNLIDELGGGLPHENRAPFLVVNYIIALAGILPPHGSVK